MRIGIRDVAAVALTGFVVGAAAVPPARAQAPDFTSVTDILAGRRVLFPVADLVVSWPTGSQFSSFVSQVVLTSQQSVFSPLYSNSVETGSVVSNAGRMFDLPYDVGVTVGTGTVGITTAAGLPQTQSYATPFAISGSQPVALQFPRGDFTGDGFADFAFIAGGNVYALTAADSGDPGAGVVFSTAAAPPFALNGPAVLAAGDFDGDGIDDVALAAAQAGSATVTVTIYRASVTPGGVAPQAIALVPAYAYTFTAPSAVTTMVATAGNFGGVGNATVTNPDNGVVRDQLLLVYKYEQGGAQVVATLLGLGSTAQLQAFGATTVRSGGSVALSGVDSGYLLFPGSAEQAVVSYQGTDQGHLAVLVAGSDLSLQVASQTQLPGPGSSHIYGVVVGNFGWPARNLTLQTAVLACDGSTPAVHVYSIADTTTFALARGSSTRLEQAGSCTPSQGPAGVAAGDLQGRSLVLGAPAKLAVQHTQPRLILAMPPMHVDWITPANGSAPEILNLSAVLGGFYSSFQTSVTNQAQSSTQSTTSYANAVSESVTAGYKWVGPGGGSISASVTESAGLMHDQSVAHAYGTYSSTAFDVSAGTGFDDAVWYNAERHNVYVYPVIGQTACPAATPACAPADELPMTVMFSGPDQIVQEVAAGGTLEWFQPVWEPGNVLSYPWSFAQLQAQYPALDLLTSATPTEFATDDSTLTEEAQWATQSSSTVTTGSATNIWWGVSVSVSQKPGITGGPSGSATLSYNGSTAISDLYTSTTTLGESTGIGIAKPGTFPNPGNYQYGIVPYIFGNAPAAGAAQQFMLGTDILTDGILQAAFLADPTFPGAGSWWQGAYALPDLALNHPLRWSVQTITTGAVDASCVRVSTTSTTVSCATFNAPEPDIWNSEFYWMKGLFITPAATPGEGPQLTQATAGDAVQLAVRVYNYSLVDMPAGSQPVVQFYAQPWDTSTNTPAGNAVLVDQVALGAIPGFNSAQAAGTLPNWALASTTALDTAAFAGQQLVFWVLVWIDDGAGGMGSEMAGHGMTQQPGTLTDIAQAVAYVEPYSNNVGLYHTTFYIAPATPPTAANRSMTGVAIADFAATPARATLHQKVSVSATLHGIDGGRDGVTAMFYDGDPAEGARVFDVELIGHVRAGEGHQVRVPFRPRACGTHTLHLRIHPQHAVATTTLEVAADPLPFMQALIARTSGLPMRGSDRMHLLALLREGDRLLRAGDIPAARVPLAHYRSAVTTLRGNMIASPTADDLLAQIALTLSCAAS